MRGEVTAAEGMGAKGTGGEDRGGDWSGGEGQGVKGMGWEGKEGDSCGVQKNPYNRPWSQKNGADR